MNLNYIKKELKDLKKSNNIINECNTTSLYDLIVEEPRYYLLFFQRYLRKEGVDFLDKIKLTSDLLFIPELESYRKCFEEECKNILLKRFFK